MKLNHLNLTVSDVQEAADFLVKYFGMQQVGGNKGMAFLTDQKDGWGFVLTLMKGAKGQTEYPGNFHIGFFIEGGRETVDNLHRRLKADGFEVPPPEDTGHSYGFYVNAPGGFMVEVGV